MIEYLKNILPRIQMASKQLDQTEVFVDKSWVLFDEETNQQTEYLFLRQNNELIITTGGIGKTGKWRLSPSNDKLILDYENVTYVYKGAFIDDALMALSLSGTNNPKTLFINPAKIPDLNYKVYLDEVANRLKINSPNKPDYMTQKPFEEISEFFHGFTFSENKYDDDKNLIDGYKWNRLTGYMNRRDSYDYYKSGKFIRSYILYYFFAKGGSKIHILLQKKSNIDNYKPGDIVYYLDDSRKFIGKQKTIIIKDDFIDSQLIIDSKGQVQKYKDFVVVKVLIVLFGIATFVSFVFGVFFLT